MITNDVTVETLVLPKPLSIRNADTIRELLLGQLQERHEVVVELEDDADSDLSIIQLLEAARIDARSRGASFNLSKPASQQMQATLRRAGFLSEGDPASCMFWLHRKEVQ